MTDKNDDHNSGVVEEDDSAEQAMDEILKDPAKKALLLRKMGLDEDKDIGEGT